MKRLPRSVWNKVLITIFLLGLIVWSFGILKIDQLTFAIVLVAILLAWKASDRVLIAFFISSVVAAVSALMIYNSLSVETAKIVANKISSFTFYLILGAVIRNLLLVRHSDSLKQTSPRKVKKIVKIKTKAKKLFSSAIDGVVKNNDMHPQ